MKNLDDWIRTLANLTIRFIVQHSTTEPVNPAARLPQKSKLCNLCKEHVNVMNTAADPDPDPNPTMQLGVTLTSATLY